MVYEVSYDLSGDNNERRNDYAVLEECMDLLGDALRLEYSVWLIETSTSPQLVEAFLWSKMQWRDRLAVTVAPKVIYGQGFSEEQERWMAAHGIRRCPSILTAARMVPEFEAKLRRKKAMQDALEAAARRTLRPLPIPLPRVTSARPNVSLAKALEPLLNPQPTKDLLGALGIGNLPTSAGVNLGLLGLGLPPKGR